MESQHEETQEAIAIGQEIKRIVTEQYGLPEDATDEQVDKAVYRSTDCGAWLKFTETGVRKGSVQGGISGRGVKQ